MVSLASVIGRKVAIRPKARDDWHEVANLWGAIVGRPGVLKSPALAEVMRPLHRLEQTAREAHEATTMEWEASQAANKIRRSAAQQNALKDAKAGKSFDATALVEGESDERPRGRRARARST
jgi:putative DNA primase/helicase